jgi:hypothetical protein
MILEAFSQYLREPEHAGQPALGVLARWLQEQFSEPVRSGVPISEPAGMANHVRRVLQAELDYSFDEGQFYFFGLTRYGQRLVKQLTEYCHSYDNWQFTRWLHHIKASDFKVS